MKRITAGLPVFWLVDGEYDSWRGGLLLDGGQEGKLTFTPEQLYHFFCDVCWGVNCSPNIWRNKMKWKEIMSLCQLFSHAMCRLPPPCTLGKSASNILSELITHGETQSNTFTLWNISETALAVLSGKKKKKIICWCQQASSTASYACLDSKLCIDVCVRLWYKRTLCSLKDRKIKENQQRSRFSLGISTCIRVALFPTSS